MSADRLALARLPKELRNLHKEPLELIQAAPLPANIFVWHVSRAPSLQLARRPLAV